MKGELFMTYRYLQIFMAVAEYGKMSEAAKQLYITQSSVSQAISSIEKEYGILLFERLSHGLYLTPEGEELLAYAKALAAAKHDMDEFLEASARSRKLRVGTTVTVGTCVISPILNAVKSTMPDMDISVYISNTHVIEEHILNNSLDIALVEGIVKSPDIISRNVIPDRLVLIGAPGHRFSDRAFVEAYELTDEAMILREYGSGTRARFEEQMNSKGCPVKVRWECSNSEAIKNAVKGGHGLSVISERLVRDDVNDGTMWACDIKDIELRRYFSIVYHKNKYISDSIKVFIDKCQEFAVNERTGK